MAPRGDYPAAHAAACCASPQALLPRLSRGAVARLPTLRAHFHGDFDRVLSLALQDGGNGDGGSGDGDALFFSALHVRTMNPKVREQSCWAGGSCGTPRSCRVDRDCSHMTRSPL